MDFEAIRSIADVESSADALCVKAGADARALLQQAEQKAVQIREDAVKAAQEAAAKALEDAKQRGEADAEAKKAEYEASLEAVRKAAQEKVPDAARLIIERIVGR